MPVGDYDLTPYGLAAWSKRWETEHLGVFEKANSTLEMQVRSLKKRCYDPAFKDYDLYGGRGIIVCERWLESPELFVTDMGLRPSAKHSIERRNNNGDYSPENCYWATAKQQARNRRSNCLITFRDETYCLAEWAERTGIKWSTIWQRLFAMGWSVERALTQPVRVGNYGR